MPRRIVHATPARLDGATRSLRRWTQLRKMLVVPASKGQLTALEHAMVALIAAGCTNHSEAYRRAGGKGHRHADHHASKILARPHVRARLDELRAKADRAAVLTRTRKREFLAAVVERAYVGTGHERLDRHCPLAAIKVDNEMTGDNAPQRVEAEVTLSAVLAALRPTTGLPDPAEFAAVPAPPTALDLAKPVQSATNGHKTPQNGRKTANGVKAHANGNGAGKAGQSHGKQARRIRREFDD